ncbi:hypothetical protein [Streptomyces sp. AC495_CC817]|uniref:hypothetical protein n=1 Tax=Streptomyces sp. AC495_CC817 TaxID=2823900 RepID=UPI001C262D6F|nr:hypothetical protein [Streptomyces sp. AC495_CC817]
MRLCTFPGCERLPHGSNVPHVMWDTRTESFVPIAEQRTPAQLMTERRARINREKAERIARQVVEEMIGTGSLHAIATAAALAALTEKEAAR